MSGRSQEVFPWILQVEDSEETFDALSSFGLYATLHAKLASALAKVVRGEIARTIGINVEAMARKGRAMAGRVSQADLRELRNRRR